MGLVHAHLQLIVGVLLAPIQQYLNRLVRLVDIPTQLGREGRRLVRGAAAAASPVFTAIDGTDRTGW